MAQGTCFSDPPKLFSILKPDRRLDLLQDLLAVVVEELVHRVRQQLVLPVEQVVHVDYNLRF